MIFFAVGAPIPFTFVSSERVDELTFTTTVVDFPDFFGVLEAGGVLGLGEALGLGDTLGLGDSLGLGESLGMVPDAGILSIEPGVVPPPVPGGVKSWAFGVPTGVEGATPPGAEGTPGAEGMTPVGAEGMLTGVLGSWAETAKGRATPTEQHRARINFWGTIAHFSS
jgi:hypothetical protein